MCVKVNGISLDKVVIVMGPPRFQPEQIEQVKAFMDWLRYKEHHPQFVFVYSKADTVSKAKRTANLGTMLQKLSVTPVWVMVQHPSSRDNLKFNTQPYKGSQELAVGFNPEASFDTVKADCCNLGDVILTRVTRSRIHFEESWCSLM